MPLELNLNPTTVKKIQRFFEDPNYKDYLEHATAFNRKLNEERKMRIPYIDGQTGVAQKHYNSVRNSRERMPGRNFGQIYSYPEKHWRKKKFQYLKFFLQPKIRYDILESARSEFINGQSLGPGGIGGVPVGVPGGSGGPIVDNSGLVNEDSNHSGGGGKDSSEKADWSYYEDEIFPDAGEEDVNSDSDFEYEDSYTRKSKSGGKRGGRKGESTGSRGSGSKRGGGNKRRTHADSIPDSEKPFSCDQCGARYKTRPGLTYHYNHSHKDGADQDFHHEDGDSRGPMGSCGSSLTPPSTPGGGGGSGNPLASGGGGGGGGGDLAAAQAAAAAAAAQAAAEQQQQLAGFQGRTSSRRGGQVSYREGEMMSYGGDEPPQMPVQHHMGYPHPPSSSQPGHPPPPPPPPAPQGSSSFRGPAGQNLPPGSTVVQNAGPKKTMHGQDRAPSLGYCDFCLGDAAENKKSGQPEELVACAECGRSGHPSCLQFTDNMIISVKKYPWQCIECKCCTLCGTSENDDQLLFCDDCDRGYHMYCLVPPIKEPPEGSWSCQLCIETFHKK